MMKYIQKILKVSKIEFGKTFKNYLLLFKVIFFGLCIIFFNTILFFIIIFFFSFLFLCIQYITVKCWVVIKDYCVALNNYKSYKHA